MSHDTPADIWLKMILVWGSWLISKETLSYFMLIVSIAYTLVLLVTLIRDKWIRKDKQ